MSKQINVVEQMWHNDNHTLILRINRSELEILDVLCPVPETGGECTNASGECVVQWFIERYGMDCNGGVCMAEAEMKICWTLIGDKTDYESSQLWFMPVKDEIFQAWLTANS
jgi:hypothetical protein